MSPNSPPPVDEATWRNRFIMVNLARIGATIVALIGLAIWHSDFVRPGGAVEIGLPMAVIGVIASFVAPRMLVSKWRTPPGQ